MTAAAESEQARVKRHYQRTLFDGIAERYEASRPGYPAQVVDFVIATAGLGAGAAVLEIGCGTGQLTERLAASGFRLTAIDIGSSMIAAARHHLAGADVSFEITSFENLAAADASFHLVISAAAFHWIDPEVVDSRQAVLPACDVIALERTRGTFLGWPHDAQRQFTEELWQLLDSRPAVHLTRHTSATMAQVLPDRRT